MAIFQLRFTKKGKLVANQPWQGTPESAKQHARSQISFQNADTVEVIEGGRTIASYDKRKK